MTKAKKNWYLFWSMALNLKPLQCINFMDVIGMGRHAQGTVQKDNKRDLKIRIRSIGLTKIIDGIQNIVLCQPGNVKNQY